MLLPSINETARRAQVTDTFRGYHHAASLRVGDGYMYDMENMSCKDYPVLSTRMGRTVEKELTASGGIVAAEKMLVVDDGKVIYDGQSYDMALATGTKQLVAMGAYVTIWPDKKYFNTQDPEDRGSLAMERSVTGDVIFTLSDDTGTAYDNVTVSNTAPASPAAGALWLDTSGSVHVLKKWDATANTWVEITTTYIKVSLASIGEDVNVYDGLDLSGFAYAGDNTALKDQIEGLNGTHIIYGAGDDYIVLSGVLDQTYTQTGATVTVARKVPDMDYVTECGNRLWGCKYGVVDGTALNEIYACKIGDFKNWNSFAGYADDSYVAQRGSKGPWTGAITFQGFPVFFKENAIETVYPSATGSHNIQSVEAHGVQLGSWRSLQVVNNTLFYKGTMDVYAYSGAMPVPVGAALGDTVYSDARGGSYGGKYYLNMKTGDKYALFVLDTEKNVWAKEDALQVQMFDFLGGELYAVDEVNQKLLCLTAEGEGAEAEFPWGFTTGALEFQYPGSKYLSRLQIRANIDGGADCFIRYDGGLWVKKAHLQGDGISTYTVPVMPTRCDHLQIMVKGKGTARIYSIANVLETEWGGNKR